MLNLVETCFTLSLNESNFLNFDMRKKLKLLNYNVPPLNCNPRKCTLTLVWFLRYSFVPISVHETDQPPRGSFEPEGK